MHSKSLLIKILLHYIFKVETKTLKLLSNHAGNLLMADTVISWSQLECLFQAKAHK